MIEDKQEITRQSKTAIREVFNKFDKDKSGKIDINEISLLAKDLNVEISKEEVNQIFKDLDENGDNQISFEEFWSWWSHGRQNKLEKLVYYKLKSMKLLKQAHSEFTRFGSSLESKFDDKIDIHYYAFNYGESKGQFRLNFTAYFNNEEGNNIIKSNQQKFKLDKEQNPLAFIIRFECLKNQQQVALELEQLVGDAFKLAKLFGGSQLRELLGNYQYRTSTSDKEVSLLILPDKEQYQQYTEHIIFSGIEQQINKSQSKLEISLGLRNSLQQLTKNPQEKLIKWLLDGFLLEMKLTVKQGIMKTVRQMLMQNLEQQLQYSTENKKQKYKTWLAILSLLEATKVHITFRDLNDADQFYRNLGLTQLIDQQPSCEEIFQEIAQIFQMEDWKNTEGNRFNKILLWKVIQFLNKYAKSTGGITIQLNNILFHLDLKSEGFCDLVNFMAKYNPPQEDEKK